jgi:hypothetical protein
MWELGLFSNGVLRNPLIALETFLRGPFSFWFSYGSQGNDWECRNRLWETMWGLVGLMVSISHGMEQELLIFHP